MSRWKGHGTAPKVFLDSSLSPQRSTKTLTDSACSLSTEARHPPTAGPGACRGLAPMGASGRFSFNAWLRAKAMRRAPMFLVSGVGQKPDTTALRTSLGNSHRNCCTLSSRHQRWQNRANSSPLAFSPRRCSQAMKRAFTLKVSAAGLNSANVDS